MAGMLEWLLGTQGLPPGVPPGLSGAEPDAVWTGGGVQPPAQRDLPKDQANAFAPIMGLLASLMQRPTTPGFRGDSPVAPADGGWLRDNSVGARTSSGPEPSEVWSAGAPPPTNDPLSGEPKMVSGVPLPRPRPMFDGSDAGPDSPMPGAPLSLAPADYNDELPGRAAMAEGVLPKDRPMPGSEKGFFDRLLDPNKAATYFALGGGFSGAGSFGTGMRRAFSAAAPTAALMNVQGQKLEGQNATYQALLRKGVPEAEARAAIKSPDLLKALISKHYETKNAQVVNNRLVREKADGTVEVLADYSKDDTEPKLSEGYRWINPKDKSQGQVYVTGGKADPAVIAATSRLSGEPPKYAWVDPKDHSKGQYAIPGGGAEKVDAQVAARLGLAQSFQDQLPEIRRKVAAGEATGPWDAAVAKMGYGTPGELRRQIKSGSEALLRNLTGAGMNMAEAANYASRYELQPHDTAASMLSKLDQLSRELLYTDEAVKKGRGGTIKIINGKILQNAPTGGAAPGANKTSTGTTWSLEP